MRRCLVVLGLGAVAVLSVPAASAANRGVSFTPIGFIDDPGPFPYSAVLSMNPEGTVFLANPSFSGNYCVQWTREDGWGTQIGASGSVCRISSNGTVMGSGAFPGQTYAWPGTWTGVLNQWDPIPEHAGYAPCGGSRMSFFDMGGDGDFATGLTWEGCAVARGFLWDKASDTSIQLGTPNGRSTRGNAVTADGSAVIGWGTMAQGLRRAARWEDGAWTFLGDPNAEDPKECIQSGRGCTSNSASATSGCPEFVDDGMCADKGTCVAGFCVGGPDGGNACTSSSQCRGVCTGPNAGALCTSNGNCPDTLVCVNNPDWNDDLFKGEAHDVTDDGQHACGRNYNFNAKWTSGWISNPDGSFTEILPPASFPDFWDPFRISQDGKTVVGRVGNPFFGAIPAFWNEGMGSQDLQLFLVQQGLDELFFWGLLDLFDVSADGTVMGGRGINPDGKVEGFIIDMKKVWVCHAPAGQPDDARTLGIEVGSVGDHMAHGDFLGTCEFLNSGGLSRASELRERLNDQAQSGALSPFQFPGPLPSWNQEDATPVRPQGPRTRSVRTQTRGRD